MMQPKRYMLFLFDDQPLGGALDFKGYFDTVKECEEYTATHYWGYGNILDTIDNVVVKEFNDIWKTSSNHAILKEAKQLLHLIEDRELKDHIRFLFIKKDIVFTVKYYRLALGQTWLGLLRAKRDIFEICEDLLSESQKQDLEKLRSYEKLQSDC